METEDTVYKFLYYAHFRIFTGVAQDKNGTTKLLLPMDLPLN
jgi:hypothetical protein